MTVSALTGPNAAEPGASTAAIGLAVDEHVGRAGPGGETTVPPVIRVVIGCYASAV